MLLNSIKKKIKKLSNRELKYLNKKLKSPNFLENAFLPDIDDSIGNGIRLVLNPNITITNLETSLEDMEISDIEDMEISDIKDKNIQRIIKKYIRNYGTEIAEEILYGLEPMIPYSPLFEHNTYNVKFKILKTELKSINNKSYFIIDIGKTDFSKYEKDKRLKEFKNKKKEFERYVKKYNKGKKEEMLIWQMKHCFLRIVRNSYTITNFNDDYPKNYYTIKNTNTQKLEKEEDKDKIVKQLITLNKKYNTVKKIVPYWHHVELLGIKYNVDSGADSWGEGTVCFLDKEKCKKLKLGNLKEDVNLDVFYHFNRIDKL